MRIENLQLYRSFWIIWKSQENQIGKRFTERLGYKWIFNDVNATTQNMA